MNWTRLNLDLCFGNILLTSIASSNLLCLCKLWSNSLDAEVLQSVTLHSVNAQFRVWLHGSKSSWNYAFLCQSKFGEARMRPYGRIVCFHQPPQWSQQDRVAVVRWMERGLLGYPYRLIRQECWLGRHLLTCRWPVNQLVPVHFLDIRPRAAAPSHPCPSQLSTISQIPITSNCTRIKHTWCGRTKLSLICGRVSKGHKICSELPTLSDTTSAYPLRWTGAMIAAERTRRALRAIRREFMMCWGINWDCRCWQDGTFLLGYKP